jgi:hypothetical protein
MKQHYQIEVLEAPSNAKHIATKEYVDAQIGAGGVYIHHQSSPSSTWIVEHNLNTFRDVTVTLESGEKVLTDVFYINSNKIEVRFSEVQVGYVYV